MLGVSLIPWVYTLICSIHNTFFIEPNYSPNFGRVTGFDAFIGIWVICLVLYWYIFLIAIILTVLSIVLLKKTGKKAAEVPNDKEK